MSAERVWLCWSFEQACPHIESEADGLRANLRAFVANRPVSYVPIVVFESDAAAQAFADKLRSEFRSRYDALCEKRDEHGHS